jgi:hypothetical protein
MRGVRATVERLVPAFDELSQADDGAHSTCTHDGPSVRTHSKALVAVTSPTARPCGNKSGARTTDSRNGLSGGSPSREGDVQLSSIKVDRHTHSNR